MPPAPPPREPQLLDLFDDDEPAGGTMAGLTVIGRTGSTRDSNSSAGPSPAVYVAAVLGGVVVLLLVGMVVLLNRGGGEAVRPDASADHVAAATPVKQTAEVANRPAAPVAATLSAATPPREPSLALSEQDVTRRLADATVFIKLMVDGRVLSTGTGYAIETLPGNSVLLATNRHVAVPDYSELPEELVPEGTIPEIEVVFHSGEPGKEQALPAQLLGADHSEELSNDIAFLRVLNVAAPPRPIELRQAIVPELGSRYTGAGFPLGGIVNKIAETKGNPSITVTHGGIAALRRDEHGQLRLIQVDGSLQPGNSGGPIVDEKTGRLIGMAVAKFGAADTIGMLVPADEVRRALEGRVGALDFTLNPSQPGSADLVIRAQIMDPKQQVHKVSVQIAAASAVGAVRPNADGTWPPLPQTQPVPMQIDANRQVAIGRVQAALPGTGPDARKVLVQTAHTDSTGKQTYSKPREVALPDRPGRILPPGSLERVIEAMRRKSLAGLGALIDPDQDCHLRKDEDDGKVTIAVPAKLHTNSPEIRKSKKPLHNAPMTLSDVSGDFAALVLVTGDINPGSTPIKDPQGKKLPITFQGAGLVLYENADNFLRLERTALTKGDPRLVPMLLIEVVVGGKQAMEPIYQGVPDGDMMLVIVRRNGKIRCSFSPDGETIVVFREFALDFPEKMKIGLSAANVSSRPFEATFEKYTVIDKEAKLEEFAAAE